MRPASDTCVFPWNEALDMTSYDNTGSSGRAIVISLSAVHEVLLAILQKLESE